MVERYSVYNCELCCITFVHYSYSNATLVVFDRCLLATTAFCSPLTLPNRAKDNRNNNYYYKATVVVVVVNEMFLVLIRRKVILQPQFLDNCDEVIFCSDDFV